MKSRIVARLQSRKPRIAIGAAAALVALVAVIAFGAWNTLFREFPGPIDAPDVADSEYFKYGSIGTEPTEGVPYWIWAALPGIFPERLPGPGGYASLGAIWEEGKDTPIGMTRRDIGIVPRVGINCAACHTSVHRASESDTERVIVLGGASQGFDVLAYQRFLFESASDPKFNSSVILGEISEINPDFSWFEKLLYRYIVIPRTKAALLENKENWAWTYDNPDWGPGRIDPFNPVKFGILEQPVDGTIGNSDMLSIWNLKLREEAGVALHWDGLNPSLQEVVLSSAIGDGATPKSLNLENMTRIQNFLLELPPPAYPFAIDQELAAAGEAIHNEYCAACHTPGQGRAGQVIPVEEIGTDRHRVDMWGAKDAAAYNAKYGDYEWGFTEFRDIDGYVAAPLDGLWLRAPYLHNGSVPTLADLLEPPETRPQVFYRGYDVYDQEKVGFVSNVAANPQTGIPLFRYDTSMRGNSNQGHLYGVNLPAGDKAALLEFLKTQ